MYIRFVPEPNTRTECTGENKTQQPRVKIASTKTNTYMFVTRYPSQETTQNKRVLRELVAKWNRPVYEKATTHRAMRPAEDDLEAMEVNPRGGSGARRVVAGRMSQRDGPSKDEAVGNILNAKSRGLDPTKSRVPFSNGYAFSKAPRSKVERHGRAASQQVCTVRHPRLFSYHVCATCELHTVRWYLCGVSRDTVVTVTVCVRVQVRLPWGGGQPISRQGACAGRHHRRKYGRTVRCQDRKATAYLMQIPPCMYHGCHGLFSLYLTLR